MNISRSRLYIELGVCGAAIGLLLCVPDFHHLDEAVQAFFFDAASGSWMIPADRRDWVFRVFYSAPKAMLVIGSVLCVLWLVISRLLGEPVKNEEDFWSALLVLGAVAAIAGYLKSVTGVSCPLHSILYGGPFEPVTIWDRLWQHAPFERNFRCWPAGHATGGFGLFGLRLIAARWPNGFSRLHWVPGFFAGWAMGLFQMARGQHYLSHTMATMLIAWGVCCLMMLLREWYVQSAAGRPVPLSTEKGPICPGGDRWGRIIPKPDMRFGDG